MECLSLHMVHHAKVSGAHPAGSHTPTHLCLSKDPMTCKLRFVEIPAQQHALTVLH